MGIQSSTSVAVDSSAGDEIYRKVTRRLIPLLFLCYIVAFMDRVNIGFAKLEMLNDLGFSNAVYGLGAGIFFLGYFIFEVPSNLLLHKVFGARKWIARIMISWGIISAAMAMVKSVEAFYILRFLLGVAEAGFFPGVILYFTYWYPADRHGRIMSLFAVSVPIAGVVGGPISGWILHSMNGTAGLQGWQWLFILEGVPSVLIGIVVLMRLDGHIKDAKWLNADERNYLQGRLDTDVATKSGHSIMDAVRNPYVWMLALVNFSVALGVYGIAFWLPSILHNSAFHDFRVLGVVTMIPWLAAAVAMVWVGRRADRKGERRWAVAGPAIVGAIGLALSVVFATQAYVAVLMLTIATAGVVAAFPQVFRVAARLWDDSAAAVSLALVGSIGNLSGFVAPYMIGLVKTYTGTTSAAIYAIVVIILIGAGLVLSLKARVVNDAMVSGVGETITS